MPRRRRQLFLNATRQRRNNARHREVLQLEIKKINVEKLIPYVRNSRTHSDAQVAQIAASIKEFGWTNPILVDGENGIIAGHGRLLAARKLGQSEVPVIELSHMTESQKKAYVIADNQLAMNAGWDTSKFPSTNWYSDNIICHDLQKAGYQHFVSRAYVHHAGSQTVGTDFEKCHEEPRAWIKENRPDMYEAIYGDA